MSDNFSGLHDSPSQDKKQVIYAPNYTQIPNNFLDEMIPFLGEGELKVILVIFRKTFGWHKDNDRISLSQLETLTGLKRSNITQAIKGLQEKGFILKETTGENGYQESRYHLLVMENSNKVYPVPEKDPPSPAKGPTKETYQNKGEEQQQHPDSVVVVFQDEEKKREALKPFDLLETAIVSVLHLDLKKILQGIEAFEQYKTCKAIANPKGCLIQAIKNSWQPNEELTNPEEEKKIALENKRKNNYDIAENLFRQFGEEIDFDNSFVVYSDRITLKNGKNHAVIYSLLEDNVIDLLREHIKRKLNK